MQNDSNLINEAIAEAKTLRKLSMSQAKHSLVKFLKEEKLPLDDLADAELDLDHFVDLIMKRSRERDKEDDELNPKGLKYKNCMHKLSKADNEDELDERGRYNMYGEFDGSEKFEYGDDEFEDDEDDDDNEDEQSDFTDDVIEERIRKNHALLARNNFHTAPAVVSSGINTIKLSDKERHLLTKNLKYNNPNIHRESKIKNDKKDSDILHRRAGIKENTGKAKQLISDLNNKNNILID